MTSGHGQSPIGTRRTLLDGSRLADGAFALAVLGLWALGRGSAGLDDPWLLVALASAVPLYVAARAWRLPPLLHIVAVALPLSVIALALLHGYPEGASRAARYGYMAILVLAVAAWARTRQRRIAVAVAGILLLGDQYVGAWYLWWGKGDPSDLMRGLFHFHNQFGIYMAIGGALAGVIAVLGTRVIRLAGLLGVGFACAGVIASGSRASLALVIVAMALALIIAIAATGSRGALNWALAAGVGLAVTALMSSPLFFPEQEWGDIAAPERGQSPVDSGFARFRHWWVGILMGLERPLVGVGLNNYGPKNLEYGIGNYTSHPHSELILGWAEGGVIGVLPLLALYIGAVWLFLRSLLRPLPGAARPIRWLPSRAELVKDPGRWAALTALAIAVVHSLVDFDWVWPSLIAMGGVVAGAAAAPLFSDGAPLPPTSRRRIVINGVAIVMLLALATVGYLIDPLRTLPLIPIGLWDGLL